MSIFDGDHPDRGSGDATADASDNRRERPGGKIVLLVIVLLVGLLAAGYTGAYYAAGDEVPRGTTVAGVDVGGTSRAAAENDLRAELGDRVKQPVEVRVDGGSGSDERTDEVTGRDLGVEVDYEATLDATGAERSWAPSRLWDYYTGGDEVDPVVDVDEQALDATLTRLSEGLGTPPQDGQVRFESNGPTTEAAVPGQAVDTDEAADALVEALLAEDGSARSVGLTVGPAQPDVDDDDVQQALDEFANPAMSAPVTLQFKDTPVTLQPAQFAAALSMEPVDGELEPRVDQDVLARLTRKGLRGDEPVDATVALVDGKPKVVPAEPGRTYAPDDVEAGFLEALVAGDGERTVKVPASREQPDVTTADARALGIEERVSTFTTYFPYAEYRNVNIGRAGELIDGTVLEPGETFSLNDVVGERTVENGFTTGTVISNGLFVEDLGGGVSQMATTTFNAAFFAGLEDVEHKPHSVYIDRYPVGREATVAFGSVDLRFKNDTDHGVLISAQVTPSTPSSQGSATVSMYSTKTWDIEATASERYDYTSPGTQVLRTDNCLPNTGYSGFSIDVYRLFRKPGDDEVVRREKFHTDYIPSDTVVCKPPKG